MTPFLVAMVLASLWLAGAPSPVPDLRLSAAVVARPGTSVGLRAWLVDEDDEGHTVIAAPEVSVELRNAAGLTLETTRLSRSLVQGREGQLRVPDGLDEVLSLVALARIDGRDVSVERKLYVREGIDSRLPKGRSVNGFQAYELGPLRLASERHPIEVLDPRVEEGACVPGLRCWLLVWVGGDSLRVGLRGLAGVRASSESLEPSNGFVRFPLTPMGSEARVEVELFSADGSLLGAREVRLPLVPGGIVARTTEDDGRRRLGWEQLAGPEPVLVDAFQGGRWMQAFSLSPDDPYLEALGPGVWRLQVRADLFSDNTAGVTYVVVSDPDGAAPVRLAVDALMADASRDGLDPLALALSQDAETPLSPNLRRALFAVPSFDVISVGGGTSARVGEDERLEAEQELRRWQAAAVILLIGLIVSIVLLRVDRRAQARARQLLDSLGDETTAASVAAAPGRGLWAFVLLVFVLMALLALSKRWF